MNFVSIVGFLIVVLFFSLVIDVFILIFISANN